MRGNAGQVFHLPVLAASRRHKDVGHRLQGQHAIPPKGSGGRFREKIFVLLVVKKASFQVLLPASAR
jgi:hypothetical protein